MNSWKQLLRHLSLIGLTIFLVSCGTTEVSLDYQPTLNQPMSGPRMVSVGRFTDARGEDEFYLGSVRTPIGTHLETVTTKVPVSQVVRNAFSHALSVRQMLAPQSNASYVLTGEILEFYCNQVVRPAAGARIRVSLVNAETGEIVFKRIYEAERGSGAYIPGSGSPVPQLNELASRVLQDAVDNALDDSALRSRIRSISAPSPYGTNVL